MIAPLYTPPSSEHGVPEAVAFITRHWSPPGHDAAATLAATLRAQSVLRQDGLNDLAELYAQEGRKREAQRARGGKL